MKGEKFTKARHVFVPIHELAPHPKVQRRFDPSWARRIQGEFDPDKFGELAVVEEGGKLYVFDGQHRLAAAREALGPDQKVPCIIYSGMSVERQGELFLGRNAAKPVRAVDTFKVAVVACRPAETKIAAILGDFGLKVDHNYYAGTVRSPAALRKVYDRYGESTLRRALRIIGAAWGGEADAHDGILIRAVARLIHQFAADIDDDDLVRKLQRSGGPGRMVGAARDAAKTLGQDVERAATERMINIYNKGRRTKALALAQAA